MATITRFTTNRWDAIDPTTLIHLVDYRKTSTEFGSLLRHYWMPETELQYRVTTDQNDTIGKQWIRQTMTRCDADQCIWLETVLENDRNDRSMVYCSPSMGDETVCVYNRSEQTFRCSDVLDLERWPVEEHDARNQAFLRQPILTPLMPIPIGFEWHVANDDGYMDFRLESVTTHHEMTIALIRRKGEFVLNGFYQDGKKHTHDFTVHREGITAYAIHRSMILEDRTRDVYQGMPSDIETRTVKTLVRSEGRWG